MEITYEVTETRRKGNLPDDFGIRLAKKHTRDCCELEITLFYFHGPRESQTGMDGRAD